MARIRLAVSLWMVWGSQRRGVIGVFKFNVLALRWSRFALFFKLLEGYKLALSFFLSLEPGERREDLLMNAGVLRFEYCSVAEDT